MADTDQEAANADQAFSDNDQIASESDQASADRDQRASDRDQAAADERRANAVHLTAADEAAYEASRVDRGSASLARQVSKHQRARTEMDRAATAGRRDRSSEEREST